MYNNVYDDDEGDISQHSDADSKFNDWTTEVIEGSMHLKKESSLNSA